MLPPFIPRKPIRRRARAPLGPPGPPPPAPALVVNAFLSEGGEMCTLVFDRPVALQGGPPYGFSDGSIQFNDVNPVGVSIAGVGNNALEFAMPAVISPDSGWAVNAQPTWLATIVAVPQNGQIF
jgi:hypothetical protein